MHASLPIERPAVRVPLGWLGWRVFVLTAAIVDAVTKHVPRALASAGDDELMGRYCDGDSQAFEVLFDRYAGRIYRVALRRGMTTDAAEDLVQQTFVQLHQARSEYRRSGRFDSWLWTIAYNLIRDRWRRRRTQRQAERELRQLRIASDDVNRTSTESDATGETIRRALEQLSETQREVLVLHFYEGQSFAQIARVLGMKESAVRVRAHRAYRKMKSLLSDPRGANDGV